MKVKRFIGQNTQEAMQKISDEMGKDAVILNTRKIRQKGIAGFFKKPLVEVVAAVDEHVPQNNQNVKYSRWKDCTVKSRLCSVNEIYPSANVLKRLENQIAAN
jgi:flagellar biosynthesis protein FlhF